MNVLLIAIPVGRVHRIFLIPSEELTDFNMKKLDPIWCGDPPLSNMWERLDTDLKKYENPPMPCTVDAHYVIGSY